MAKLRKRKIFGAPDRPRLSVYRSLGNISAQIIDDLAGKTLASATSLTVKKEKGAQKVANAKIKQAESVGKLLAERAKAAGVDKVVFDRREYRYHGRVKALAEAARQGGLNF